MRSLIVLIIFASCGQNIKQPQHTTLTRAASEQAQSEPEAALTQPSSVKSNVVTSPEVDATAIELTCGLQECAVYKDDYHTSVMAHEKFGVTEIPDENDYKVDKSVCVAAISKIIRSEQAKECRDEYKTFFSCMSSKVKCGDFDNASVLPCQPLTADCASLFSHSGWDKDGYKTRLVEYGHTP